MDSNVRRLLTPGPAEIIRAAQKDTEYVNKLAQQLQDVSRQTFGQRAGHKWNNTLDQVSTLLYNSLTNLAGFQTLGEEYTGILQIDASGGKTPNKLVVACMIFLTTFGYSTLEYVTNLIEHCLSKSNSFKNTNTKLPTTSDLGCQKNSTCTARLQYALRIFKHYLPFLGQLHLTLFYLQGTFYNVSKRLMGIYYLLVRRSFANQDVASRRTLKYLMWISIINSLLTGINDSATFVKSAKIKDQEMSTSKNLLVMNDKAPPPASAAEDPSKRCTLCLDQRTSSSVTPCGHIFCWECIIDWLRTKQECPICREQTTPSRVVPLQNFH